MKKLWLILLIINVVLLSSCSFTNDNLQTEKEIPILTEEEALRIASEASWKYHDITLGGSTIPDCKTSNKDMIEIDGRYYYYLASCIDTPEEFNDYLSDVFTDKSIDSLIDNYMFIIKNGKVLKLYADTGGGLSWGKAEVISINQNEEFAEVEFKVPSVYSDFEDFKEETTFKYIQNQGWRVDTEAPSDLY